MRLCLSPTARARESLSMDSTSSLKKQKATKTAILVGVVALAILIIGALVVTKAIFLPCISVIMGACMIAGGGAACVGMCLKVCLDSYRAHKSRRLQENLQPDMYPGKKEHEAATTIQKWFRRYKQEKSISSLKAQNNILRLPENPDQGSEQNVASPVSTSPQVLLVPEKEVHESKPLVPSKYLEMTVVEKDGTTRTETNRKEYEAATTIQTFFLRYKQKLMRSPKTPQDFNELSDKLKEKEYIEALASDKLCALYIQVIKHEDLIFSENDMGRGKHTSAKNKIFELIQSLCSNQQKREVALIKAEVLGLKTLTPKEAEDFKPELQGRLERLLPQYNLGNLDSLDTNRLKALIYRLFSGKYRVESLEIHKQLEKLVQGDASTIAEIKAAIPVYRKEQITYFLEHGFYSLNKYRIGQRDTQPWGSSSTEIVQISHGGGYHYILDFLKGRNLGYQESPFSNRGIFVSPGVCERDKLYAERKAPQYYDRPVILKAKIQAQWLDKVRNDYEAFLRPENVRYLTDVKIQLI
jgi:hypothetical protein